MSKLAKCLAQAGALIGEDIRAAIIKQAAELRAAGVDAREAEMRAAKDHLAQIQASRKEVETAFTEGTTLYETAPETPAAAAEAEAAVSRVDQVLRDFPGLKVQMDGMDAPMSAAEYLKMVKAEADEMAADAPLMQLAAECALIHGS